MCVVFFQELIDSEPLNSLLKLCVLFKTHRARYHVSACDSQHLVGKGRKVMSSRPPEQVFINCFYSLIGPKDRQVRPETQREHMAWAAVFNLRCTLGVFTLTFTPKPCLCPNKRQLQETTGLSRILLVPPTSRYALTHNNLPVHLEMASTEVSVKTRQVLVVWKNVNTDIDFQLLIGSAPFGLNRGSAQCCSFSFILLPLK